MFDPILFMTDDEMEERQFEKQVFKENHKGSNDILESIAKTKEKAMHHMFQLSLNKLVEDNPSSSRKTKRAKLNNNDDEYEMPSKKDIMEEQRIERQDVQNMNSETVDSSDKSQSDESEGTSEDSDSDSDLTDCEENEESVQPQKQSIPPRTSQQEKKEACFLCAYCTTDEVKCISSFISDNIANMDVGFMAEQIREFIFEKRPELQTQSREYGLEVGNIRKHIRLHMLAPTVRIADMMRHLLGLCDTLKNNLYREDPDTGDVCADRGNIDTYLKVVTQVLNMYKMAEPSKMLFAQQTN